MKNIISASILFIALTLFGIFLNRKSFVVEPVKSYPKPTPVIRPVPKLFAADSGVIWREVQRWRVMNKKPEYIEDEVLCKYAELRVDEIKSDWSHSGYIKVSQTMMVEGGFSASAENLAKGSFGNSKYLEDWLNSPSHKANLEDTYTHSCIRCKQTFCVQLFGKY